MSQTLDYAAALGCLQGFADFERTGRFAVRTDTAPVGDLLQELGNPELGRLTVHVAGSKGKGSVAAMIESILRAAGLSTGLFTSPHLQRFTERIQIDGEPISPAELARGVSQVSEAARRVQRRWPERQLVTFDVLTALGFLFFKERAVDVQVVEVGLGGLLDSTNVFASKACSVITHIGLEHREILGDTLAAIAAQKAGIIVTGSPVVMAPQREAAREVIRAVAAEKGAALLDVEQLAEISEVRPGASTQSFRLRTPGGDDRILLPLLGRHQLDNAATAVVASEALAGRVQLPRAAVIRGLERVRWPARVEVIQTQPWVVLDVAHTAESAQSLSDTLVDYLGIRSATLVVGMMSDKDLAGLALAIAPRARRVIATRADHPRALPAEAVQRAFVDLGLEASAEPNVAAAVDAARAACSASDAVVILGSVALAGEARAHLLSLPRDSAFGR
jgi:dihydrofolate synthase/folylpolyglutamate synthase